MTEIRTVTTLERKREQIVQAIARYEQLAAQARADLAHITAAITLFKLEENDPSQVRGYADIHRLYKHGELIALCKEAMAKMGPCTTSELAAYCLGAKKLDSNDKILIASICNRLIHSMRQQHLRGKLVRLDKRGRACVWALPGPIPLDGFRHLQPA